jgi:hypothetical protein
MAAESFLVRVFQQAETYAQLAGMVTTLGNHVRMAGYVHNRKLTGQMLNSIANFLLSKFKPGRYQYGIQNQLYRYDPYA